MEENKVGRPRKYETVEELQKKIDEYFKLCDETVDTFTDENGKKFYIYRKPYTISGLCVYLDICRDTLCEYEKQEGFSDTIKRAKQKVENYIEEHSITGELNSTVSIFNLKNNFGWKDKTEVDSTNVNVNTTLEEYLKKAEDTSEY